MAAYYNEIEPYAATWLRNLIKSGHIADGVVDERSIVDVSAEDLKGFKQVHFFAGIGVWSYALRRAGVSDDTEVWTGSCPCQPFSGAGKGKGKDDPRHLWPEMYRLIAECRPSLVFGEQVAGKAGAEWFRTVSSDLESSRYASAGADFPACSVGAPHQRKRLYWVAYSTDRGPSLVAGAGRGSSGYLANTSGPRLEGRRVGRGSGKRTSRQSGVGDKRSAAVNGFWSGADWLGCRDGRWRPVEPGTHPLDHGSSNRVGRLRAYGNAIVAPQAEAFIAAALEAIV